MLDDYTTPEDSGIFDIAPLLMLAARTRWMLKRVAMLGFDGLTHRTALRCRHALWDVPVTYGDGLGGPRNLLPNRGVSSEFGCHRHN